MVLKFFKLHKQFLIGTFSDKLYWKKNDFQEKKYNFRKNFKYMAFKLFENHKPFTIVIFQNSIKHNWENWTKMTFLFRWEF